MRLRYPGVCSACSTEVCAGATALWQVATKSITCLACTDPEAARGVPGASAQRVADRRRANRERRVTNAHPRIGKFLLAITAEPQSTRAWATGAAGERGLGQGLEGLRSPSIEILHDRQIPGTRANIDHLAISHAGIFVIDAKRYSGLVHRRDVGTFFKVDHRLYVGRRDCSKLVEGMAKQVRAVEDALPEQAMIPIIPVLCFVNADWNMFARPFRIGKVLVTWPKALHGEIRREGAVQDPVTIARVVAARLPAAR